MQDRSSLAATVQALAILIATFACGWALMSIEILGGRVLAPNFGSDVFTWGSLISTFLIALSIGYTVGGLLSRRRPRLWMLAFMVMLGGLLILCIAEMKDTVSDHVFDLDLGERLGPLTAAIALFGLPAIVLGMISPYCVRLYTTRLDHVGATAGFLYAVSTVGSTLGTLVTTFFLIPNAGVANIFFITGAVLLGLGSLLAALSGLMRPQAIASLSLLVILGVSPAFCDERVIFQKESPYARVTVVQDGSVRILRFARKGVNTEESRIDVAHPLKQLNEYTALMFDGLLFAPHPRDVLVIGLGGGIVPQTLHSYYPNASIDVVEIDPVVVEAAEHLFSFKPDDRLRVITQDGRVYVKRCARQYDMIFLDAFQGRTIPFHLKTKEFFRELSRVLKPGGVVVSNLHRGPKLYSSERQTYQASFGENYAFAGTASGNLILVSLYENGPQLPKAALIQRATRLQDRHGFIFDLVTQTGKLQERPDWDADATVLTDDYAPVETLNRR